MSLILSMVQMLMYLGRTTEAVAWSLLNNRHKVK